jgi:CDP-paratose 2-epimerase|tara:strand:- start:61 stop:1104 length:1044 start_codon:yes stop_codon:yes gene_type:complete
MTHYLVTGGCGFLGSNIASRLVEAGEQVTIADNLSRTGSTRNLTWLRNQGTLDFVTLDVRDAPAVDAFVSRVRPDVVLHLAGQVAMTTSLADPRLDFEVNAAGSLNVLEAVRAHCPDAAVVYSSSNKVYGELGSVRLEEAERRYVAPDHPDGIDETAPLEFCTPYGCSKGAADQYLLDYARVYGLKTVVFRHSTIYGGRQFATIDQGWVGWFCSKATEATREAAVEPFSISGSGKQVRDVLYVDDAIDVYLAAAERTDSVAGQAFNIGGGIHNSSSLLELFDRLERLTGAEMRYSGGPWRAHDQRFFVADCAKAHRLLGWRPRTDIEAGVSRTLDWADELLEDMPDG